METQEDRLRRMQRERGSMVIGPHGAGFPSMSWGAPPEAPRDTETVQVTWDEKPRQSGTASATWSNNTPEGLAAEITKPKPVFARTNKDGSPNYSVPKYGLPSGPVEERAFEDRVRGGVDYVLGGDSIRNQLAYLDDVKSGNRTVDAPTSQHGLARPAPQVAAQAEPPAAAEDKDAGPLPPIPAHPVGLQAPEVPKPEDAAVERPKMVPMDANAAVQPEPVPMPSKITPAQRKMEARAKERSMQKNASMKPHLAQAARDMGIEGVPFEELTGEQIADLRYNAGKMQRDAANSQINDRQSDRNAAREMANPPMMLATAQRLASRGRVLLAQAKGLADADPKKAALQAQGEQMIADGQEKHATFMSLWDRQSSQQIDMSVLQTARLFGKAGAGIVEGHLRGQQEMARARLNDQGQRDDRKAAEEGLNARADGDNNVRLAIAGMNVTAQEIEQQRDREQRIAEMKERERLHGLDQAQRERLAKDEHDAAAHRQKLDLADKQKGRDAQAAQNPVPMQPAQQRAQLWEPLKAADSNPDDATPVQQYVDDFMQTLASQEGLQPQQRQIQGNQVKAWANQHVMSRWESDKLRDSDRGYIRSLAYATDADGNNTGKLKDRSTFVREMGSHYKGNNWASMAAKLGAFYDRLQKEEKESANLTQVGIPDYPVV